MALLADILEQAARLEGEDKANYLQYEIETLKNVVFLLEVALENIPMGMNHKNPRCLSYEELKLIQNNDKIQAIKAVRKRTNCGLKEAKDAVEEYICNSTQFFLSKNAIKNY